MKNDKFIDTLGKPCPQPIIETADAIDQMEKGQILEIHSDDWGMIPDIKAWCNSTGNNLLEIIEETDFVKAYVQKM